MRIRIRNTGYDADPFLRESNGGGGGDAAKVRDRKQSKKSVLRLSKPYTLFFFIRTCKKYTYFYCYKVGSMSRECEFRSFKMLQIHNYRIRNIGGRFMLSFLFFYSGPTTAVRSLTLAAVAVTPCHS
jgi:hypothetical protein